MLKKTIFESENLINQITSWFSRCVYILVSASLLLNPKILSAQYVEYEIYFLCFVIVFSILLFILKRVKLVRDEKKAALYARVVGIGLPIMIMPMIIVLAANSYSYNSWDAINLTGALLLFAVAPAYLFSFANSIERSQKLGWYFILLTVIFTTGLYFSLKEDNLPVGILFRIFYYSSLEFLIFRKLRVES